MFSDKENKKTCKWTIGQKRKIREIQEDQYLINVDFRGNVEKEKYQRNST
jgi:hypothetical protein